VLIEDVKQGIVELCQRTSQDRACLVGVSGIDASGKGLIASRLVSDLEAAGFRVALINVDGWLNLPYIRFRKPVDRDQAEGRHFYHNAIRLDEMFRRLILPLQRSREIDLEIDFTEETAAEFRPHKYAFKDIDIILLEGIFIFKRAFVDVFDMRIWIDTSFEIALERAIARSQENLSEADTVRAYETIYFPAQRYHFKIDRPRESAHIIFDNE
jgi:uridine kinase